MPRGYRVGKPEPEFYFHFELGRPIAEQEWETIAADLQRIAVSAFEERFADLDIRFEFEIDLEHGSIRGRIRATAKVVKKILVGLALYAGAYQGGSLLWDQSTDALTCVRTEVEEYFQRFHGVTETVRTERRRGAAARLDHLIVQYQQREVSYDQYMAEAVAILEKIQQSPERDEIIPALREYMDARNVDWQRLASNVPRDPQAPPPPADTPPARDAAVPPAHVSRRRREEDE